MPTEELNIQALALDDGVELLDLGPVPAGGRFVLAPDRDGRLRLWWAFSNGVSRRRRRAPDLPAQTRAMIEAGLDFSAILSRSPRW